MTLKNTCNGLDFILSAFLHIFLAVGRASVLAAGSEKTYESDNGYNSFHIRWFTDNKIRNPPFFNKLDVRFCCFGEKIDQLTIRLQPLRSLLSILPSTSK